LQGFTGCGSHLHLLAGSPYGRDGSVSPEGDTFTSGTGRRKKAGISCTHVPV
jgi:hypothetical protein